jgi:thiamine-phosphate pyrophosphorylase
VNDRVDVALAVGVDGVHLGARSLPVGEVRRLVGAGMWVGVSCRDAAEIEASRREGADYAFLGTMFATPTHPGVAAMGVEGLVAALAGLAGFPVIGIGGVGPASAPDLIGAGAYGVAVVRGVWDARDPAAAVRRYVRAIEGAVSEKGGGEL